MKIDYGDLYPKQFNNRIDQPIPCICIILDFATLKYNYGKYTERSKQETDFSKYR